MHLVHLMFTLLVLLGVVACDPTSQSTQPATATTEAKLESKQTAKMLEQRSLIDILNNQSQEVQVRYPYRNPKTTLEFLGIEPGMTVVEALPGGGWYSKILLPYLGSEGQLIGINYAPDLWPNFSFATDEFIARMATWTTTWVTQAETWRGPNGAKLNALVFGEIDPSQHGAADAVLFIRALHNMARFNNRPYLKEAIQNAYDILKPGGIVGVVQHEARADMPDAWADGSSGYLKRSFVIAQMTATGFEFAGASEVNQNPKDRPNSEDFVWRLPPSLRTSDDNLELRAELMAVGESNRMTLKFIKPAT